MTGVELLYDLVAEHDLIGALLVSPHEVPGVLDLDRADFFDPDARVAFEAIRDLHDHAEPIELLWVADRAIRMGEELDRTVLMDWMASTTFSGSVSTLADRLVSCAQRRALYGRCVETLDALKDNPAVDASVLAEDLRAALDDLRAPMAGIELSTTAAVAARSTDLDRWLIPGLMRPTDAVMIVAAEGIGKSQLARQVAICAEAGLHPFVRSTRGVDPIRVLTVDLENKPRAVTDTVVKVMRAMERERPDFSPQCPIWELPRGIDLLSSRDRARFTRAVVDTRPDLVFLGPLYKSYRRPRDLTDEQAVDEVIQFLDDLRIRYNLGLWMENHAPHGDGRWRNLRPIGTSVWMRWPEFGKSFRPDPDDSNAFIVESFRGDRSETFWPDRLIRGVKGWPFTGHYRDRPDLQAFGWPAPPEDRMF